MIWLARDLTQTTTTAFTRLNHSVNYVYVISESVEKNGLNGGRVTLWIRVQSPSGEMIDCAFGNATFDGHVVIKKTGCYLLQVAQNIFIKAEIENGSDGGSMDNVSVGVE